MNALRLYFIPLLFWSCLAYAKTNHQVVAVVDGDTIKVLNQGKTEKIRLAYIDAPEMGQPFGKNAKQALSDYIFDQAVNVKRYGKDRYGRTLAVIYLNQENINLKMVEEGFAWVYTRYTDDQIYFDAQQIAETNQRGLWSLPAHEQVAPWDWRKIESRINQPRRK